MNVTIKTATVNDLQKVQELNLKLFEKQAKDIEICKQKEQEELKEKRDEFLETANGIINNNKDLERKEKVALLTEAGIPMQIINELLPQDVADEVGQAKSGSAPDQ